MYGNKTNISVRCRGNENMNVTMKTPTCEYGRPCLLTTYNA